MSKVMFKRKNTNEIKGLSVEDGSLIYNYETGETYMDYGNDRLPINKLPKTEKQKIYSSDDDTNSYSCGYINKNIAKMETIFSGTGTKPTGTGTSGQAITTTTKNPLDYDIVFVTVTNSGSTGEQIVVPVLNNTQKVNNVYFYVLKEYNASLRIYIRENSIILQIPEITGWSVTNLYIIDAVGIKFQNV